MNGITNDDFAERTDARQTSIEGILMCAPAPPTEQEAVGTDETDEVRRETEDITAETDVSGGSRLRRLGAACCALLGIIGVLCYIGLGCEAVRYLRDGGFGRVVASSIFGGSLTMVEALPEPYIPTEDGGTETETDGENSANAEYIGAVSADIGCDEPSDVFNETKYSADISDSAVAASVPEADGKRAVLIIHTHGTEAYAAENGGAADGFRSTDTETNIVAVGKAFAEKLAECGVRAYHCETMFDEEEYISAYERSAKAVLEYRERYPDIAYVLDIHRDAVIRENGAAVRSDGGCGAQLMIVCGTDEMGADFPDWRDNFAFGAAYQRRLWDRESRIVRHMNLRSASFNQQLCDRYLLLEVGTCGNTVEEAKASARIAAEELADLISADG